MSSKGFYGFLAFLGQLLNMKNPYFLAMMGTIALFWKGLNKSRCFY